MSKRRAAINSLVTLSLAVYLATAAIISETSVLRSMCGLRGLWQMLACVDDGAIVGPNIVKDVWFVIDGRKLTVLDASGQVENEFSMTCKPAGDLIEINLHRANARRDHTPCLGIANLAGEIMHICLSEEGGQTRPVPFVSEQGSRSQAMQFRRIK